MLVKIAVCSIDGFTGIITCMVIISATLVSKIINDNTRRNIEWKVAFVL